MKSILIVKDIMFKSVLIFKKLINTLTVKRILFFLYFLLLFVFLIFYYGFLPGKVYNLNVFIVLSYLTDALSKSHGNFFNLGLFGYPADFRILNGLPFSLISWILNIIFNNSFFSILFTNIFFLFIAFVSFYFLLLKFGIKKIISITFSFIFLLSPFIRAHILSYAQIGINFSLIPLYILVDILIFEKLSKNNKLTDFFLCFSIYLFARVFCIFMDGYGYVISAISSGFIFLFFIRKSIIERRFLNSTYLSIVILFSNLFSYFLYSAYIGKSSYKVMQIDFFRGMSLDLITLFVPHKTLFFLFDKFNIGWCYNPLAFYGDGNHVYFNYIGYTLLLISMVYFFVKKKFTYFYPLLFSGLIALLLSLGPSLKFNNQNPDIVSNKVIGGIKTEHYLMPKDRALLDLHTDFIYLKVPGIKNMRSVYRWIVLFKIVILVFSSVFINEIFNNFKLGNIFGSIALFLIIIEQFPNLPPLFESYKKNFNMYMRINKDIIEGLNKYLNSGQLVFFLSEENDFMANYISSKLGVVTYNTGGDKNIELAFNKWPDIIKKLRWKSSYKFNESEIVSLLKSGFEDDLYDSVIIQYFNMRWATYYWPPKIEEVEFERKKNFKIVEYFKNSRDYYVISENYFDIIQTKKLRKLEIGNELDEFYDFTKNFKNAKIIGNNNAKGLNSWGKRVILIDYGRNKSIFNMNNNGFIYSLKLPKNKKIILTGKVGFHKEAKLWKSKDGKILSDGFRALIKLYSNQETNVIFNNYFTVTNDDKFFLIDISKYSGEKVRVEYSIVNDEGKNSLADWAVWRNLKIFVNKE